MAHPPPWKRHPHRVTVQQVDGGGAWVSVFTGMIDARIYPVRDRLVQSDFGVTHGRQMRMHTDFFAEDGSLQGGSLATGMRVIHDPSSYAEGVSDAPLHVFSIQSVSHPAGIGASTECDLSIGPTEGYSA